MSLKKSYEPFDLELFWLKQWEDKSLYSYNFENSDLSKTFCIQLPPPNVTGTLHMGHAFNQTLMDTLIRWQRMKSTRTLWIPGTDHAGIATQMVVERQLENNGKKKEDIGRELFLDKVWEWKEKSGNTITNQMRKLGSSCDWSKEYFTMDEVRSDVVKKVFVELYRQNLIYRGKRLVNWDPVLKTAVSDLEVVNEDSTGNIWEIRYPLIDKSSSLSDHRQSITVATTRPETLFGDVAVAVNPKDVRYSNLIGKFVLLPIVEKPIQIIADESVDQDFGTGCVKITPAHDFNDYEVAKRHALKAITIFTLDAKINNNGPKEYLGLDRYEARRKVVKQLKKLNLLGPIKEHSHVIKKGDRSGSVIEPMLTDQWFLDVNKLSPKGTRQEGKSLAQQGLDALDQGKLKFSPSNWEITYKNWLKDIQDWCISRQLWWGHQIPAWYKGNETGKVISKEEVFVCHNYEEAQRLAKKSGWNGPLVRETDVLDTWFSSALVPFSSLINEEQIWNEQTNSPNLKKNLKDFLPSSVLVTGFDIIFFWVARMVMLTNHFCNVVPFKNVYIHALVRDSDGQKMSKSKGNTLDPLDIINGITLDKLNDKRCLGLMNPQMVEKIKSKTVKEFPNGISAYGVDALRFTFASLASPGRNINFDLSRCEGYRNFCNKLWNATRFVLMQCLSKDNGISKCAGDCGPDGYLDFSFADRWIMSKQHENIESVDRHLHNYRFDLASKELYEFIWNEYCDWYIEVAKTQLIEKKDNIQRATRRTMLRVLENALRLLHPFIPFITEELWQNVAPLSGKSKKIVSGEFESIMTVDFPKADSKKIDQNSIKQMSLLKGVVSCIRVLRSEMKLSPGDRPTAIVLFDNNSIKIDGLVGNLENESFSNPLFLKILKNLAKLSNISVVNKLPIDAENFPSKIFKKLKIVLVVSIDKKKEIIRIEKEIKIIKTEMIKVNEKLKNSNFLAKAPKNIVLKEKERFISLNENLEKLFDQKKKLSI